MAVHRDLALERVVEATEQVGDAGLARATGPDQGHDLAGGHVEAHVVQHFFAGGIAKVHVIESHLALDGRQFHRVRRILDVGRLVQQLKDALAGGDGFLKDVVHLGQAVDGFVKGGDVGQKGHQRAQRERPVHDHHGPGAQHDDGTHEGHKAHGREKGGPVAHALDASLVVVLALAGKARQLALLLGKGLDDADS